MFTEPIFNIIDNLKKNPEFLDFLKKNGKDSKDKDIIIKDYQKYASWVVKFNLLRSSKNIFEKINNKKLDTILELASGRGNDLNRWILLKIPHIVGVEIDPEQYTESIKRLESSKKQVKNAGIKVEYSLGSALSQSDVSKALNGNKPDIVVCNFALNYFFKDSDTVEKFFKTITSSMKKGSLFIGTCADGDVIDYLLKMWGPINNYLYSIRSCKNKEDSSEEDCSEEDCSEEEIQDIYNKQNCYEIALKTPYFEEGTKIYTEYLVNKNNLIDICKKYNLFPIKIDRYDPIVNFKYIDDYNPKNMYKHGSTIRILYFRFSFVYRPN